MRVNVSQPVLPPLNEFFPFLERIWINKWLTNQGPYHEQFENELADYLGVKYISLFVNGTIALIAALKALNIKGEVITSPYSFVATTHALWWNNIKPVFVDIEPDTMNIDPARIEVVITPDTTAILPVHVYGYPCNMSKIKEIANKHSLKIIYDSAHAFGVKTEDQSILNFGDLSVLSFHATKVFNTIEGGAIVCHSETMKHHIDNLRNFGIRDETTVEEPGINGKMNELIAAYGLLQLKYIDQNISKRKLITEKYRENLTGIRGIRYFNDLNGVTHNYGYFPILVDELLYGKTRDELYFRLQLNNIFSRRYFYPLISDFPVYRNLPSAKKSNLPVATKVARQVICLPIYPELDLQIVERISEIIRKFQR